MEMKNLLLSLALMAGMTASAAPVFYVSPEGAGTKDGSSAENALDLAGFVTQAAANEDGTTYNLAGGKYSLTKTVVFKKSTSATVNGSAEGNRTVFSGDVNGDGTANEGDLKCLMRFETVTVDNSKKFVVNNIDFTGASTAIENDATNDGTTGIDGDGALYFFNSGDVTVENCNFYNNVAGKKLGGPAAQCVSSTTRFINCSFYDNNATSRGGAVRLRSNSTKKERPLL